MGRNQGKQFNLEKRAILARLIAKEHTAKEIAVILDMDPTSVSRELKRNRSLIKEATTPVTICTICSHRKYCILKRICGSLTCSQKCVDCKRVESCKKFQEFRCNKTKKFPFVCNHCIKQNLCPFAQYQYFPDYAESVARQRLICTREGANLTLEEHQRQDAVLQDAIIQKGQSVHHALVVHRDVLKCSEKTLYRRIEKGVYTTRLYHLPRQVSLKKRKMKSKYEYVHDPRVDRTGHLYSDWLIFRLKNQITYYFQMDFLGAPRKSSKEILVLTMPHLSFSLLFIVENKNQNKICLLFNTLQKQIGLHNFKKLFPAILTDRDTVFDDFNSLEFDENGELRTRIFFCNPGESNQKPYVENYNAQMRVSFPKHASLDSYTQDDIDEVSSNLNSRHLSSIDDRTPYDLFLEIFGKDLLDALHIHRVDGKDVKLRPIH